MEKLDNTRRNFYRKKDVLDAVCILMGLGLVSEQILADKIDSDDKKLMVEKLAEMSDEKLLYLYESCIDNFNELMLEIKRILVG